MEEDSLAAGTGMAAPAAALAGPWKGECGRSTRAGCGAAGARAWARRACLLCLLCGRRAAAAPQLPALGIPPGTGAWPGARGRRVAAQRAQTPGSRLCSAGAMPAAPQGLRTAGMSRCWCCSGAA